MSTDRAAAAAFYCVADSRYFLGAVGMINSLRLQGHDEPIHLLDCGLTDAQRELLARETILHRAPPKTPPYLLKTVAPLASPAAAMALIDVDMIATRPLSKLLDRAAGGEVIAFRNDSERHVEAWGELLGLGETPPGPYVSSGLVLAGGAPGLELIRILDRHQRQVEFDRGFYGRNERGYAFTYPEQDVLNAILRSAGWRERLVALEHRLAPNQPFPGLRLLDEGALRCAYRDAAEPYVLHHYLDKPWLEPMYHGIYSRLLARLLLGDDVALRVDEGEVPLRMRAGARAWIERKRVDIPDLIGWRLRGLLPDRAVERVDERRRRRLGGRA